MKTKKASEFSKLPAEDKVILFFGYIPGRSENFV